MWEIDRTSILSAQKCPRDRFYSRHFQGQGIERIRKSLPLVFGSAFHAGAEDLLRGEIEAAVAKAINYLNLAFSVESVDLDDKQTDYAIGEQKAIAEGLLRGWWAFDGPRFLRDFEVIEVEQEGRAELAEGMVLMFRPDALVRERSTGDLYIVSWKTASTFGQYTINQINSDMQSMSEVWGVEQKGEPCGGCKGIGTVGYDACTDCLGRGEVPSNLKIEGVLYLFAVKGQRKLDDYLGFKVQNTPLAYGWVRPGNTPDESEWAWTYGWATEETNPKTMKLVQTKLGKGFRKVSIWDNYPGGVKQWIADLAAQRIEPRHLNALEGVFPQSMPVSRRADEIESWRRQVVAQEKRIKEAESFMDESASLVAENRMTREEFNENLDELFPQSTARCWDYQSPCQFMDVCFKPAVKADPLASGLYSIRTANHPESKGGEE